MIITSERTTSQEAIIEHYGAAADQLGRSPAEVLEAIPVGREGHPSEAVLEVNGVKFDSFREHVGATHPKVLSRGGGEVTPSVVGEKVFTKSRGMKDKENLIDAADAEAQALGEDPTPPEIVEPENEGGKSGIRVSEEQIADMTNADWEELIGQHVDAHNINPLTNVMATDINTSSKHMDMAARKLIPQWGDKAGAAASGVSKKYGGEPELQAPRTGQGASIALDEYFKWRYRRGDARVQEAMDGGRPLTVLMQGLGKAGAHHLLTLPSYLRVRGLKERGGAIVAKGGVDDFLRATPEELLQLSRQTGLGKESIEELPDAEWLEPDQLRDFWASGAHVISPCYDRNQFDAQDALNMSEETIVAEAVANGPFTKGAQRAMAVREVDVIPEEVDNVGGTAASRGIWEKFMYPDLWTPQYFEAKWNGRMRNISRLVLRRTAQERSDTGEFVPMSHASKLIILETTFRRVDARS